MQIEYQYLDMKIKWICYTLRKQRTVRIAVPGVEDIAVV